MLCKWIFCGSCAERDLKTNQGVKWQVIKEQSMKATMSAKKQQTKSQSIVNQWFGLEHKTLELIQGKIMWLYPDKAAIVVGWAFFLPIFHE